MIFDDNYHNRRNGRRDESAISRSMHQNVATGDCNNYMRRHEISVAKKDETIVTFIYCRNHTKKTYEQYKTENDETD